MFGGQDHISLRSYPLENPLVLDVLQLEIVYVHLLSQVLNVLLDRLPYVLLAFRKRIQSLKHSFDLLFNDDRHPYRTFQLLLQTSRRLEGGLLDVDSYADLYYKRIGLLAKLRPYEVA